MSMPFSNLGSCPVCRQDLSTITEEEYGFPPASNGDLAVCCVCGGILEVVDGKFTAVTARALLERGDSPDVLLALVSVQAAVKRRNRARQAREN